MSGPDSHVDSIGWRRPEVAVLRHRLTAHVRLPLHRDGYALALNSAFTAATGLIYWIVAANAFTAHAVGLNSALISAMTLLSGIASLNLPNIIVRFLPESGDRTLARVVCAYSAAAGLAACAAVVFILGVTWWTPPLRFLRFDHGLQSWFVFSTVAWCLFTIQDSVLTALGRAIWVPVENAVFSVLKIALLVAAATALPRYGIFVSWTIAMLVSVAGVNVLIFARLMRPARLRRGDAVDVRNRAFVRYFAADYACSVAWLSNLYLMPLIVTAVAGATTNAYWALAFTVALPLYAVSQNIGTSLMLHGAIDREALPTLARKAAIQGARVLIPAVILLVVGAPLLLSLFGSDYAQRSTTVLRVLAIGVLPNLLITLSVDIARVQRRLRRAVIALGAEALIALGLAPPLLKAMGVTGVAIGWTGAQVVVAAGLLATWRGSLQPGENKQPSPVARAMAPVQPAGGVSSNGAMLDPGDPHPVLGALFSDLERRGLRWVLLRVPSCLSAPTGDVDILVTPQDAAALRQSAEGLGFVALPGWDAAPDLVLVRYDRPSDRWLVLDVSTAVSFRRPRSWTLAGATDQVLRDRSVRHGVALPSDPDEFWLLLLHCLLDKGFVAPHHLARLRRLASVAGQSSLGKQVCSAAGPAFSEAQFVTAARSGDTSRLRSLGIDLAADLKRRRTVAQRLGALGRHALTIARKPLLLRRRRGPSLALLGPNGVGKSTAAAQLQLSVPFDVRIVYMGMWKASEHRGRLWTLAEIAIRPLRIWCRYLRAQYHQLRGRVVVFDRYVYDAFLPTATQLSFAKRMYFFLLAHVIPGPRAAVFLDVPGRVAYGRKPEATADELESERLLYAELTRRSFPVQLIDAGADADTVRAEITTILWRELTLRWRGALASV